jgi:2',3'-cyclic-nucleotide 2'-phosphodiesterase
VTFRLLFVGDVVGRDGCSAVLDLVPKLRADLRLDAVVANAENSAVRVRSSALFVRLR